jgi:hypothetical protein
MLNHDAMPEMFALLEEIELRKNEPSIARLARAIDARHKAHPELVVASLGGLAERMNAARKRADEELVLERA